MIAVLSRCTWDGEPSVSPMKCQWRLLPHICPAPGQQSRPNYTGPRCQNAWPRWAKGEPNSCPGLFWIGIGSGDELEIQKKNEEDLFFQVLTIIGIELRERALTIYDLKRQILVDMLASFIYAIVIHRLNNPGKDFVDKMSFLPSPAWKSTSQAWLSFSASPSNMKKMPSRSCLQQLLLPPLTA